MCDAFKLGIPFFYYLGALHDNQYKQWEHGMEDMYSSLCESTMYMFSRLLEIAKK